jgi:DnaJ domain
MSKRCLSTALHRTAVTHMSPLCRDPLDLGTVTTRRITVPNERHHRGQRIGHQNRYGLSFDYACVGGGYNQQVRYFDSRRRKPKRKKVENPFKVLGVTEQTLYKDVKKAFLVLAMKNHPDRAAQDKALTEDEKEAMREVFITARIAFESLTVNEVDGMAIRKSDKAKLDQEAEDNFDSWFKTETGFDSPFQFDMDPETMKEVAKMTEELSVGLDRDGGMWTLAKMVTSAVKSGGEAGAMLRLDAGDSRKGANQNNDSPDGILRRRRNR